VLSSVVIKIPSAVKLLITSARIVLPVSRTRPFTLLPALTPSRSMSGAFVYPGCDVPSISIGTMMLGKADAVAIVQMPVAAL
jgi:hypothetical protein